MLSEEWKLNAEVVPSFPKHIRTHARPIQLIFPEILRDDALYPSARVKGEPVDPVKPARFALCFLQLQVQPSRKVGTGWNVDLLAVSTLYSDVMVGVRKMRDQVGHEKTGISARVAFPTLLMEFDDERRKINEFWSSGGTGGRCQLFNHPRNTLDMIKNFFFFNLNFRYLRKITLCLQLYDIVVLEKTWGPVPILLNPSGLLMLKTPL